MSLAGAAPRPARHPVALAAGAIATAAACGVALGLPDPALPGVFAAALLLGIAFVVLDHGFAGGFRALIERGDGRMAGASFLAPAVALLVIVPVSAAAEGYGRFVAPVGLSLALGAMVFGIGMQIANGCCSGVLVAAGQGSRRMWVALPCFCLGGVGGSLLLPAALDWPSLGTLDLVAWFGSWGGLLAMQALLLAGALLVLRGARPTPAMLRGAAVIGGLAALLFLASGLPWGITTGLAIWGAQAVQGLGFELSGFGFWRMEAFGAALRDHPLASHSAIADLGLLLGAFLAAAARGGLRHGTPLGLRGAAGAAVGGLLMGIGARLSFGCNVGAFLGGAASASLHGLAWFLCALPGCWIGIRLRPLFGFAPGR